MLLTETQLVKTCNNLSTHLVWACYEKPPSNLKITSCSLARVWDIGSALSIQGLKNPIKCKWKVDNACVTEFIFQKILSVWYLSTHFHNKRTINQSSVWLIVPLLCWCCAVVCWRTFFQVIIKGFACKAWCYERHSVFIFLAPLCFSYLLFDFPEVWKIEICIPNAVLLEKQSSLPYRSMMIRIFTSSVLLPTPVWTWAVTALPCCHFTSSKWSLVLVCPEIESIQIHSTALLWMPLCGEKWGTHSPHLCSPNDAACRSNPRGNDTNVFTAGLFSCVSVGPSKNTEAWI